MTNYKRHHTGLPRNKYHKEDHFDPETMRQIAAYERSTQQFWMTILIVVVCTGMLILVPAVVSVASIVRGIHLHFIWYFLVINGLTLE